MISIQQLPTKATLCLLSLLLCPPIVWGQTLDLLSSYGLAEQEDAVIRAAQAQKQANQESRPQALADLLPAINLSGDTSDVRQESVSSFTTGTSQFRDEGYALRARQPLFNWGRWVRFQQASVTANRADTEYEIARQELILRLAERYLRVLNAQTSRDVAITERNAIERQLEQARQRFEVGLIAITDVHDAQARFDLASATLIAAEDNLESQQEALREIIQVDQFELIPLAQELPFSPPEPANIKAWEQKAEQDNLSLQLARADVAIAKYDISAERAAHLPTLDLVGSHTYRDSGSGSLGSGFTTESDTWGLEASLTLFEGGKTVSRTRQAAFKHQQLIEQLIGQLRETQRNTRDSYRSVISSSYRIQALQQAVVSNQSALEANEVGLEVGTRTIVDVLDAQRNLSQAQLQLTLERHTYVLNILRLKQNAGSLSLEDIATVNAWLQAPAKND